MKINELVKVGERTELRERIIPAVYDEDGNLISAETTEQYEVVVPVMQVVTRDMTAYEESQYNADISSVYPTEELNEDDITEILADHEYRLCLMELGVTEDDL